MEKMAFATNEGSGNAIPAAIISRRVCNSFEPPESIARFPYIVRKIIKTKIRKIIKIIKKKHTKYCRSCRDLLIARAL